jgi:hypothetical protein
MKTFSKFFNKSGRNLLTIMALVCGLVIAATALVSCDSDSGDDKGGGNKGGVPSTVTWDVQVKNETTNGNGTITGIKIESDYTEEASFETVEKTGLSVAPGASEKISITGTPKVQGNGYDSEYKYVNFRVTVTLTDLYNTSASSPGRSTDRGHCVYAFGDGIEFTNNSGKTAVFTLSEGTNNSVDGSILSYYGSLSPNPEWE